MKVVSVSHLFPNQVLPDFGVFVKERLKALNKKVKLDVVAPLPFFPFIPRYNRFMEISGEEYFDSLHVYHPKYLVLPKVLKGIDGYLYYWSVNPFISGNICMKDANILDFHWVYPDAFAGLRWAKNYNKKIVVTIRGNESISYFENSIRKKLIRETLKGVDHIISVSNDLKKKVVRDYGIENRKVTVIPNGIEFEKFKRIDRKVARNLCGLERQKKYILSVSRLSHEKGIKHLLEAFAALDIENVELLIVGHGPLKESLVNLAVALKIDENVRFVGGVMHDRMMQWYNAADVFCLPSLWEGCPNVIIESLACGTPVVSTTVGGIPDLVSDEEYGFLVPAGESRLLAAALSKALKKKWDRQKIAQHGSKNSWANVADSVVDVFQSVLTVES